MEERYLLKIKQCLDKYRILLACIFLVACFFRILFFSYARPFWNDECALALNLLDNWNFFKPLVYNQAAPQLFLYISKILFEVFPNKDLALRIIPLLSSIISVPLFVCLCEKIFEKRITTLWASAIFAVCYNLCYYAQEFKQYSSDVMCFLLVLLSYFYLDRFKTLTSKIVYGLVCALLVWFSFSTLFALGAIFILLCFDFKRFKSYIPSYLPVILSCVFFILVNHYHQDNNYLHDYWKDGFINPNFSNLWKIFISYVKYIFNSVLPAIFIIVSACLMLLKDRKNMGNCLILLPLCISIVLSYCSVYPIMMRVSLFLAPIFIILCVKLFDFIKLKNEFLSALIIFILAAPVFYHMISISNSNIVHKRYFADDILSPIKLSQQISTPDDILYISDGSWISFEYYKNYVKIKNSIEGDDKRYNDNDEYIKHLEQTLNRGKTYYLVYSHHPGKQNRLEAVMLWAKGKQYYKIYADKNYNALIVFTM